MSAGLRCNYPKDGPGFFPGSQHGLGVRSYSPTALQNYAACPYKFFLQAVHKLAPREISEAIDELDPLQRGSLIHQIQFELFERLKKANLLPISRQNLERAGKTLDYVIEEVARQIYSDLAPAIDRVWDDGIDSIRVDLREWLQSGGVVSRHFDNLDAILEFDFGWLSKKILVKRHFSPHS